MIPMLHLLTGFGILVCALGDSRLDGRHSFSLTTFDTDGNLGQVDRAMEAASLGTPLIAVARAHDVLLAAPQYLPSPLLMEDDGTSRFAQITSEIVVAHSGLSADGRVLVAAAQRLAVQHAFAWGDQEIPLGVFLQELSLICQEYTMKPATRPFGVTLVIGYVPHNNNNNNDDDDKSQPLLLRVDPSGAVSSLGSFAVVNGPRDLDSPSLRQSCLDLRGQRNDAHNSEASPHSGISTILQSALQESGRRRANEEGTVLPGTILSCVLSSTCGFSVCRHAQTEAN